MAQLESFKDELQKVGALLFYIAAEKREGIFKPQKYLAEHPISFPFLLDEDRTVTKAYGVYHRLGKDAINIARTATFVIDTHQRVLHFSQPLREVGVLIAHPKLIAHSSQLIAQSTPKENS